VFLRLVSELRRLGAEVVFADFSRLIICTHKHDLNGGRRRPGRGLRKPLRKPRSKPAARVLLAVAPLCSTS
jgi:hypothetical protein